MEQQRKQQSFYLAGIMIKRWLLILLQMVQHDQEVTIFHTFWGLNALRKDEHVEVKKTFIEKCLKDDATRR